MTRQCAFKYTGDMVLGMHDALVEITGILAGLAFAIASTRVILMTGTIAAVSASLSMTAANYMARRTDNNPDALVCAGYTGLMYMITSFAIIAPFGLIHHRGAAVGAMIGVAVAIILIFNAVTRRGATRPFWARAGEMLGVCFGVAMTSFLIGQMAKYFLGISI
ncbi:hypothetical protein HDR63_02855 [bacterium]|nr:hypothetical protein [bacterium]